MKVLHRRGRRVGTVGDRPGVMTAEGRGAHREKEKSRKFGLGIEMSIVYRAGKKSKRLRRREYRDEFFGLAW